MYINIMSYPRMLKLFLWNKKKIYYLMLFTTQNIIINLFLLYFTLHVHILSLILVNWALYSVSDVDVLYSK